MIRAFFLIILILASPTVALADDIETFLVNPASKGTAGQSAWKFVEKRATYGPSTASADICLDGWMRFLAGGLVEMVCANGKPGRARWSIGGSQGDGRTLILEGTERQEFVLYTRGGAEPRIRLQDPETSRNEIKVYYVFGWSAPYGSTK